MMYIWKSVQSFKQHIIDMTLFRQKHEDLSHSQNDMVGNMPEPGEFYPARVQSDLKVIVSNRTKTKLVPIWEFELPRGVQN